MLYLQSFLLVVAANERDLFKLVLTCIEAYASRVVPIRAPITSNPLNFLLGRVPIRPGLLTLLANFLTFVLKWVIQHHLVPSLVLIGDLKLLHAFIDVLFV
jgi:hypothetical protein